MNLKIFIDLIIPKDEKELDEMYHQAAYWIEKIGIKQAILFPWNQNTEGKIKNLEYQMERYNESEKYERKFYVYFPERGDNNITTHETVHVIKAAIRNARLGNYESLTIITTWPSLLNDFNKMIEYRYLENDQILMVQRTTLFSSYQIYKHFDIKL